MYFLPPPVWIPSVAASGIDIKTLQVIAGHADIKMTLDRYVHKHKEEIIEASSLIGRVFSSL